MPHDEQLETNINKIIDEIDNESCILVMGPEFYFLSENDEEDVKSIQDYLANEVIKEEDKRYLTEEGLFYCTNENQNTDILIEIRKYYGGLKPNAFYEKIAKIPFNLYISLSPDTLLDKVFGDLKFDRQFAAYAPGLNTNNIEDFKGLAKPTKANPLIYNLMGKHTTKDSIVFTYETLFTYMYYMFKQEEDPAKKHIRECFSNANYFLFLGFRFDKWYLKLLFFLFKRGFIASDQYSPDGGFNRKKKFALLFKKPNVSDNILEYYKNEFQFNFLAGSQFEFINRFYEVCEQRKLIRTKEDTADLEVLELRNRIQEGKTAEAIKVIKRITNRGDIEKVIKCTRILYTGDNGKNELIDKIEGDYAGQIFSKNRKSITDDRFQVEISRLKNWVETELLVQ